MKETDRNPKITAVIQTGSGPAVLELPQGVIELRASLRAHGILENPKDILFTLKDDLLGMNVSGENELGKHLLHLFSEGESLSRINSVTALATDLPEAMREEVTQNILNDRYDSVENFLAGLSQIYQDRVETQSGMSMG